MDTMISMNIIRRAGVFIAAAALLAGALIGIAPGGFRVELRELDWRAAPEPGRLQQPL